MKKTNLTILLYFLCTIIYAQSSFEWNVNFDSPYDWVSLTVTGNLLVSNDKGLYAIDPEKKGIIWHQEDLHYVKSTQIEEIENTPFAYINEVREKKSSKHKLLGKLKDQVKNLETLGRSKTNFLIINTYSGVLLFDSRDFNFTTILGKIFLLDKEAFFIMATENNQRVLALIDLNGKGVIWKTQIPIKTKKILADKKFYKPVVTPNGDLLFSYTDHFFKLDGNTGKVIWQKKYPTIRNISFNEEAANVFYAKAGMDAAFNAFSLETGAPLWFDVLPNNLGNMFKNREKKETEKIKATGGLYSGLDNTRNLDILKNSRHQIQNGTQLFSTSKYGFNYFDNRNGKPLWKKPQQFPDHDVKSVTKINQGYLIKLATNNNWHIGLADKNGNQIWVSPPIRYGEYMPLWTMTDFGIVYMTDQELGVLNKITGNHKLKKPFILNTEKGYIPTIDWNKGLAFVLQNEKVWKIDFRSGQVNQIIDKVKFKGDQKEPANTLEVLDDGYFLSNSQNLWKFNENGNILYQKYYKKPGLPMWLKRAAKSSLNFATNVALIYFSYQITTNSLESFYLTGDNNDLNNMLLFHPDNPDNPLYEIGAELQYAYNRALSRKYAGLTLNNESLVLTKLSSGDIGMYRINNQTGEEIDNLILNDKKPKYILDEHLNVFYYFPSKKEVQAFRLN